MLKDLLRAWTRKSVMQKGLRGNSPMWLAVGAFGLLRRLYDRRGRRSEQIVLGERIRPGDELVVRYPGKPGRTTRREIEATLAKRTHEAEVHRRRVDALATAAAGTGRKARKAQRALSELTSSGERQQ